MRREAAVIVVVGLAFSSCQGPARPPCPNGQACMVLPVGDVFDGCDPKNKNRGAALVKVKIELRVEPGTDRCVANTEPKRVCVIDGGGIRWRVQNHCDLPDNPDGVLKITGDEVGWLDCDPKLTALEKEPDPSNPPARPNKKNQLFCGVPDGTAVDDYKYKVEGPGIQLEDPWIEVKRGA